MCRCLLSVEKVALLPESASTSGHTTVNIHISNSNVNVGGIPGFSEFTDGKLSKPKVSLAVAVLNTHICASDCTSI